MSPHLTATGRALLLVSVSFILMGAVATSWPAVLLGEVLAVALAVLYLNQIAHLKAIEEGFVGIAVRDLTVGHSRGGLAGRPSPLEVELINTSGLAFSHLRLVPEADAGMQLDPPVLELEHLRPRERVKVRIQVTSAAAGRRVLHGFRLRGEGLAGLVAASDYIPTPLPLVFLPAVTARKRNISSTRRDGIDMQVMGLHQRKQRGFGTSFRELRDHVVGDPFRNISWKATARTGRLMVREFDDEVVANAYVILDISSTMRGGAANRTKLDHSVEMVAEFAALMARNQDQLGLITFDELVYGHIRQGNARKQYREYIDHLVGLGSVVHGEFTELDNEQVTGQLVRYLMVQERLDFRRRGHRRVPGTFPAAEEQYDVELLNYWLARELPAETERIGDRCLDAGLVRRDDLDVMRRFCQLRGVSVPYRLEARFGAKEAGLVRALQRFMTDSRESNVVLLVTDLCGLVNTAEIQRALRVVLARKHRVVVAMPYTPDYVQLEGEGGGKGEYERGSALLEVFRLAERRERARIARAVGSLGVGVVPLGPSDGLDTVFRGAPARKRVGRAARSE